VGSIPITRPTHAFKEIHSLDLFLLMLANKRFIDNNTNMSEVPRPITRAVWTHEEHKLSHAEEKIIEFQETGRPIEIWHDSWREDMATYRTSNLTSPERTRAIMQVLELCGIGEDFHKDIKLLKKDTSLDDTILPNELTFKDHTPAPNEIFQWLGDYGSATRDDPNDFNVGFAIDAPVGLVVLKYRSEEPFEDDDMLETLYQIALYPKDQIDDIYWHISKFNSQA
jgi:hypothetical protein